MLVLGINTVADACEAALVGEGGVIATISEPMAQGHDARLAPIVERLMLESGTPFPQLTRVAVVVGPGSFTGVRVGVAFARALALALEIPVVGVSSLEALADMPQDRRVLGLLPAKRRPPERTWWLQMVNLGRGEGEPSEASENELRELVADADAVCGGLIDVPDTGVARIVSGPSAVAAAVFAARLSADDLPAARPIYVRPPDATPMVRP